MTHPVARPRPLHDYNVRHATRKNCPLDFGARSARKGDFPDPWPSHPPLWACEGKANGSAFPPFSRPTADLLAGRRRLPGRGRGLSGCRLARRACRHPHRSAQDESRSDTYRLLTLFGDVFERVRADYVDPVTDKDLVDNALNGMLTGLDPHSGYMDAKAFRDMQVQTKGEFGGLGIEVTQEGGFIKVISPIDDTPAAKAGIKPGDIITAIDGKTVEGMSLNDAVDHDARPARTPRSP